MGFTPDSHRIRRTPAPGEAKPPVVLPHVVIAVTETGTLDVTVDGATFAPPEDGPSWMRANFGRLLDAITAERTVTVRIEVRESDGTVFTDIIHTRRPTTPEPVRELVPETRRSRRAWHTTAPALVEVTAGGFVPGEDVAVAVVVSTTDATGTGSARALLDTTQLAGITEHTAVEVVLHGRISGTTHLQRLP